MCVCVGKNLLLQQLGVVNPEAVEPFENLSAPNLKYIVYIYIYSHTRTYKHMHTCICRYKAVVSATGCSESWVIAAISEPARFQFEICCVYIHPHALTPTHIHPFSRVWLGIKRQNHSFSDGA